MSAQEGPVSCHYCKKRQDNGGRCPDCAKNNNLDIVITFRWVRDVYLTHNDKQYLISFSNMTDNARISFSPGGKTILEVPASANLTLQNIRDKLKTYLLFL